jgi:chemosensory pili system protein ChpA (sensor histidine kinase/response regulator)
MPKNIDTKMLSRFVHMASSSLERIRTGIASFLHDATQHDALENAYEDLHPLKESAAMFGLAPLSHITASIEEMIEDIAAAPEPVDPARGEHILAAVDTIGQYLASLLADDGRTEAIVTVAVQALRRFKGLPEGEDAAAVDTVLTEPDTTPAPPAPQDHTAPAVAVEEAAVPPALATATAVPAADSALADMSAELLDGFLLEAEEYLDTIGRLLPEVSDQPEHKELLQQVRRSVHTLKGAAGVVGLRTVSRLAHRLEDLLDELYDGRVLLTPQAKDLMVATFDALDDFLRDKRGQGQLDASVEALYHSYDAVLGGSDTPATTAEAVPEAMAQPAAAPPPAAAGEPPPESQAVSTPDPVNAPGAQAPDVLRVPLGRVDELVRLVSELIISRSTYEQHLSHLARQVEEMHLSIDRLRRVTSTIETQYEVSALMGHRHATSRPAAGTPLGPRVVTSSAAEFDELEFDRYSEFHLVSRELSETAADIGALGQEFRDILGDFDSYLTRQGRLTSEVQDKLMQLRMVPLGTLATRLQRTVRVTAKQKDKDVALVLEGEEVQFDKTMLEDMAEPLLHILRNAVDHGIEPQVLRQELGKSVQGCIRLRAYREGTQIVVQIRDDGAGLDPQRIRAVAMQRGLISETEAAQLSDAESYQLIFTPGFSTASEVSEISGRGVGMDIVHTTVSRLKGRISIDSTPGQGTTFTIRLPLTLAIARVLLVKAHSETFAIPLADVTQILRIEPETLERIGDTPVIRLAGQVLPVIRLGERLRLRQPADSSVRQLPVVVTQVADRQVAVIVDQLLGGREVVVKPLGTHLRRVQGLIGSTLMGDGSIVLILNPSELVQRASPAVTPRPAARPAAMPRSADNVQVLIVDDSFSVRRVVSNLIKSVGWQPLMAKDGLEALDLIQRAERLPDVLLLDVEMPQMDGYELTSTLRAHPSYRHLPVVMLTSRSGEKHRQKAFEVGATEYLVKPYRDETLLGVVRRLVSHAGGVTAA